MKKTTRPLLPALLLAAVLLLSTACSTGTAAVTSTEREITFTLPDGAETTLFDEVLYGYETLPDGSNRSIADGSVGFLEAQDPIITGPDGTEYRPQWTFLGERRAVYTVSVPAGVPNSSLTVSVPPAFYVERPLDEPLVIPLDTGEVDGQKLLTLEEPEEAEPASLHVSFADPEHIPFSTSTTGDPHLLLDGQELELRTAQLMGAIAEGTFTSAVLEFSLPEGRTWQEASLIVYGINDRWTFDGGYTFTEETGAQE